MPSTEFFVRFVRRGPILGVVLLLGAAIGVLTACDTGGGNGEPGPPARLQLTFANNAAFVVDSTVTARALVSDADGQLVEGATVNWSAEQGSVAPTTSTTNAQGTAQTRWTLGPNSTGSDAQSLTASVEGAENVAISRAVNVNPGPVASIFVESDQDTIAVDSSATLSIERLEDANGNRIQNPLQYTFTWNSLTPDTATVTVGTPSTRAQVQGVGHGAAQITVSTGGGPGASAETLGSVSGAAADTVVVEVLEHELRGSGSRPRTPTCSTVGPTSRRRWTSWTRTTSMPSSRSSGTTPRRRTRAR